MRRARSAFGLMAMATAAIGVLSACGPRDSGEAIHSVPTVEGAYGTKLTVGDLEAHMVPQLVTSPDPPGRGIEYQKYQDRRQTVNSVIVRVPVNEPEELNIRLYVESRQNWDFHGTPVVSRTRIYAEQTDPLTEEKHRTLLETHSAVHGLRVPVEDSPSLVFDFMPYRERFGEVVTLIAESEILLMEPGTSTALVDPMLASAPVNARTRVRSNPLRIEFERSLVPPTRPLILLPEETSEADTEEQTETVEEPEDAIPAVE